MRADLGPILPIVDVGVADSGVLRDGHVPPERVLEVTDALLAGGAQTLELRGKVLPARDLLELARGMLGRTRAAGARLLVNDRPDVALLAGADGVHLGQEDLPATEVRRWLPAQMLIGVSCHSPPQAAQAAAEGAADYIGYGPVYPTGSKKNPDPVVGLEELGRVCATHPALPVVAIGGIGVERLVAVRRAGARSAAMISALLSGGDPAALIRGAIERWASGDPR